MRNFLFWILLLCSCQFVLAQNLRITQNTFEKVAISFTSDSLQVENVTLSEGTFSLVTMKGYGISYNPGAPQLPQLTKLIQTPVCDSVIVTVVNANYTEYDAAELGILHMVYPTQVSVSRSEQNPPFSYSQSIYSTNEFYALPLVSVVKAGIRRDLALANVYVSPVQYNPVTNRIRIYTQIDVEFSFANTDMAMTRHLEQYASPMFALDTDWVINKMENTTRNEYAGAPIKYLIIGNSTFSTNTDLAAFADWKRRLGYIVEIAYTSDASVGTTTTSIKNFIQDKYNNATVTDPAPTFLLLLGDVAQLPAFTGQTSSGHVTDLYYATLAGSDNIPDCYYGRLSATNNTQLSNQIAKIMMYESYSMPDPSYLGKAVLIAGTDGNGYSPTHADGQINYIYENYVYTGSTTHQYTTVYKHNYNCSSQAATIRSEINAGVGLANYTAHGSSSGWADPEFTTSHVSSMTNAGKYGLLIGNCCVSGKFDESECFGESLLRAANKGAMGYIGASNNSYWNEDVYWAVGVRSNINANMAYDASHLGAYDKWFHTHGEAYSNWVSTIGGIMQGGNLAVQSSSSTRKQYYWEIYHCFGDPSVRVYMGIPNAMTVTADASITLGSSSYTAQVAPYAYVALKQNTTDFIAAAFANANGAVTLTLPGSLESGHYELVVLAQNYIPYFQDIEVLDDGDCPTPSNAQVSNITAFTATISWTGSGNSYNIQLRTNSTDWTTVATNVTNTYYTFTGLQENTDYQVRVQSVCTDETSYWKNITFSTPIACPAPVDLVCVSVTANTAYLAWTETGSANSWTLQYGTNSSFASGTFTEVNITTTSTNLTGLTAETNHYARVRANCGGAYGESQWSETCTFMPTAVQTVEIGTSDNTNNYLPSYSYYNYELSQQLYTPAEIGSAGTIYSVDFYNTGNEETRTYDIYLVNTNKTAFSSNQDWITVTNANKVFSGTVTMTTDAWTTLTFDTPFEYDGSSNLALITDDNTGSYTSSPHMSCQVFNGTSNCAIYKYNDNTNYDPSSPSGITGSRLNVKNHIRIRILQSEPHIIPSYLTISGNTAVCPGATTTLTANTNVEVSYLWSTGETTQTITASAGTYTVTVTSSTGYQLSTSVTVTTNPTYNTPIEAEICEGESYNFFGQILNEAGVYTHTLTSTNGCDSVITMTLTVSPSVSNEFTIVTEDECYTWNDQTYCESGDYTQSLQTIYGCDSIVTLHLTITVGIDAHNVLADFKVYPNPTDAIVNVQLSMNNDLSENVIIQVFDVYGKLMDVVETRGTTSIQTSQINLSRYANGVYFIKAVTEGNVLAVRKVVKNR